MKRSLYCILFLLSLLTPMSGFGWDGNDITIYWALDENASVDNTSMLSIFLSANYPNDELGVRILAYDSNGNFIKYLNPIYTWIDGTKEIDWEYPDQQIGTGDNLYDTRASQAYFGSESMLEKFFQMEVGQYDEDYNFYPFLYSNAEDVSGHWYDWGSMSPPGTDWIPHSFYTINPVMPSIPEPSVSLLMLIGIGLLGLRRHV